MNSPAVSPAMSLENGLQEEQLRGRLHRDQPLSGYTMWGIGGPAQQLFVPADREDLIVGIRQLPPSQPLHWLGLGSNVLVRDGGVPGTVVLTTRALGGLAMVRGQVWAGAGVPCPKIARFCAERGLTGSEFLSGIPGSLGGALAMNAGAFGGETWAVVGAVETLDRQGVVRQRPKSAYRYGYRRVEGPPDEAFMAATFDLQPGDATKAKDAIRALLRQRAATQPTGRRSCGSVFQNPPGDFAGRLIEASGCKGLRVGGAVVSCKHANFIINEGNASAADVESLMQTVMDRVRTARGVRLVPEVRIIGAVP